MTISTYLNFFKKFISHKLYTVIDKPYKSIFFDTWDLKYTFFLYSLSFFFCIHWTSTLDLYFFFTSVEYQLSLAFDLKNTFFYIRWTSTRSRFRSEIYFFFTGVWASTQFHSRPKIFYIRQTTTQSCPLFIWNTIRREKTFQVCLYIAKVKV